MSRLELDKILTSCQKQIFPEKPLFSPDMPLDMHLCSLDNLHLQEFRRRPIVSLRRRRPLVWTGNCGALIGVQPATSQHRASDPSYKVSATQIYFKQCKACSTWDIVLKDPLACLTRYLKYLPQIRFKLTSNVQTQRVYSSAEHSYNITCDKKS